MKKVVCYITKTRKYSTRSLEQQVSDLEKQLFAEREVYPALLQRCGRERCLHLAKRIHTHLSRSGFRNDVFLSNLLVQTYTRCSSLCEARKTFDSNPNKNAHSWNIMIVGHLQNSDSDSAFALYEQMWLLGIHYIHPPVLVLLVRSISSLESLRLLHKRVVCELSNDPITCAAFVRKYGGFGCLQEAKNAFNTLSTGKRDAICWTALISVYAQNMHGREAIEIFKEMDTPPDLIAFVTAIDACSTIRDAQHGIWLHNRASQEGFKSHILATSLVTLYGRCGLVAFARSVFDQHQGFPMDIVSWNAMIAAFAQNGHHLEAVEMFETMSLAPNATTYATVIDACASIGALERGKSIHRKLGDDAVKDLFVGTALLNMYGRCGVIQPAKDIFDSMQWRDPVAWSAMITAYAQNGYVTETLELFERMTLEEDLIPDWVTYVGVLSACSHGGLVRDGIAYFRRMHDEYDIQPRVEHYSCLIDLFARTGRLAEAEELLNAMPFSPNEVTWTAFLNACRIHGDVERGVRAAEAMVEVEPGNADAYIALAGVYSSAGKEQDAMRVRAKLAESGVQLLRGTSSIEVRGRVHVFESGNACMRLELESLSKQMEEMGRFAGFYTQEEDCVHSEKLALVYGLHTCPDGAALHIVKNNGRMCMESHAGFKVASEVTGRVVTVRDATRIHKFEKGGCSCGDYW